MRLLILETPPGATDDHPPGRRPPGGHKRGRSAVDQGKVAADRTTIEDAIEDADEAAFERRQADPNRERGMR